MQEKGAQLEPSAGATRGGWAMPMRDHPSLQQPRAKTQESSPAARVSSQDAGDLYNSQYPPIKISSSSLIVVGIKNYIVSLCLEIP
ncbi:hypothetical protein DV515_00009642 [Chloebia gouldiae]|uniref:Uncharacterized protein n=1 Tax=Chloebia gouldiae TaxID=44316 RepID=A0A3L8SCA2_CHLGU|nr:hypothetical protein DV515_00009642 [Chloebia gouldiae]